MSGLQKICLGFFVVLMGAAALNYVPGLTDDDGLAFGIFALDIYDDALHAASAIWALIAGLTSRTAARTFCVLFGALYLGDGALGLATGSGYLDLGIFTNPSAGMSFTLLRFLANLPHLFLGGFALWSWWKLDGTR